MRVLQVAEGIQYGGAEIQVDAICAALLARGHDVTVLAQAGGEFAERARTRYADVVTWNLRREFLPWQPFLFGRLVRRRRIDLVNIHNPRPITMALLARTLGYRFKLVVTRRVGFPVSEASAKVKWRSRKIDAFVTIAGEFRDYWLSMGIPPERMHVISSGSDMTRFFPGAGDGTRLRAELGLPADARVVVKVANFYPWKGHGTLVAAARTLAAERDDLFFVLVGAGPEVDESTLRGEVRDAGLERRVLFAGRRDDMPDVYAAADVVFHGTLEGDAPAGSVREAMAMERPVVVSATGPLRELVTDGETGLLFPPGDAAAAAAALRRALDDRDDAQARARAAGARVRTELTLEAMQRKTLALYERLVGPGKGAGGAGVAPPARE